MGNQRLKYKIKNALIYITPALLVVYAIYTKSHKETPKGEKRPWSFWDLIVPNSNDAERGFYTIIFFLVIICILFLIIIIRKRLKGFGKINDSNTLDVLTKYVKRLLNTPVGDAILNLELPRNMGTIQLVRTTRGISIAIPLVTKESIALQGRFEEICNSQKYSFEYLTPDSFNGSKRDMLMVHLSNDPDEVSRTTSKFLKMAFNIGTQEIIRYEGTLAAS